MVCPELRARKAIVAAAANSEQPQSARLLPDALATQANFTEQSLAAFSLHETQRERISGRHTPIGFEHDANRQRLQTRHHMLAGDVAWPVQPVKPHSDFGLRVAHPDYELARQQRVAKRCSLQGSVNAPNGIGHVFPGGIRAYPL